jgi:hypothetical protein
MFEVAPRGRLQTAQPCPVHRCLLRKWNEARPERESFYLIEGEDEDGKDALHAQRGCGVHTGLPPRTRVQTALHSAGPDPTGLTFLTTFPLLIYAFCTLLI